ncbi:hypothetical protein [Bradyrhizobium genosp. A]|uniref:tetratricopeptide repeat protein n=1 Tax=Bradyrhizobium genosp. A TaxID=83626 RepID=UPI003CEDF267
MAPPEVEEKSASTPLEAERTRLRNEGYTEAEVSQILIARVTGQSQPNAGGQGVLSNVISSMVAVGGYARGTLFSIRSDIAAIFDSTAPTPVRAVASASLVVKSIVIAVLGYAAWQEWKQHIVSAPEIAAQEVQIKQETARNAPVLQTATAEAAASEAKIKEATAREALRRQKAEADEAVARACKTRMEQLAQNMYPSDFSADGSTVKAGSRTARMIELYNKDCSPDVAAAKPPAFDDAVEGYKGIKKILMEDSLGSPNKVADMDASISASCLMGVRTFTALQLGDAGSDGMVGDSIPVCSGADLAYKLEEITNVALGSPHDLSKAPDEKTKNVWASQDVATDIKQCTDRRQSYADLLACSCVAGATFGATKAIPTGDSRARQSVMEESNTVCRGLSVKFAESDGEIAAKKYQDFRRLIASLRLIANINEEHKAGRYDEAFELSQKNVAAEEAREIKDKGKAGDATAGALANLSWHALFARKYAEAIAAANRSIELKPNDLVPETNRAHALMMLGRTAEARAIYSAHKGEKIRSSRVWEQVIADDFAELRKAGITHPLMEEIAADWRLSTPAVKAEAPPPASPLRLTASTPAAVLPLPPITASPPPDPDIEAARRYKLAADRGDAEAQLDLGKMYEAGRGGLPSDPQEAARFYKLAADQGYAEAQVQLAYMYENGNVLPKDLRQAARLYRLAADQGNAAGQSNLADFYERGDAGLRKDACEAMRLRKLAADQGNTYAAKNLKEMRVGRCKS